MILKYLRKCWITPLHLLYLCCHSLFVCWVGDWKLKTKLRQMNSIRNSHFTVSFRLKNVYVVLEHNKHNTRPAMNEHNRLDLVWLNGYCFSILHEWIHIYWKLANQQIKKKVSLCLAVFYATAIIYDVTGGYKEICTGFCLH